MKTIKKIFDLLNSKERKQFYLLFVLILLMSLIDMFGVASIFPFVSLLSNPELVETNEILIFVYEKSKIFGIENSNQFLFFFGSLIFVLLISSLTLRGLTTFLQIRFTLLREYSIGKLLINKYLQQRYEWFLNQNSSNLGKNILSEVRQLIYQVIVPMMSLISQAAITLALLSLLLFIDMQLALNIGIILFITYGLIFLLMKNFLYKSGNARFNSNQERFLIINEAFGAVKEVKLGGFEKNYVDRFSIPAKEYAKNQSLAEIIGQLPRYFVEGIAFGGMIIMVLFLMARDGDFVSTVPIVSIYAFAGYRLIPALQQIYGALTQLKFSNPAIESVHNHAMNLPFLKNNESNEPINLKESIKLNNINFSYNQNKKIILKNINLTIPAFSKVGIIGPTGSGKSTLVDIILGLLNPSSGNLIIDDKILNSSNIRNWQKNIGYVPQQIYLSDNSILENIAFGIEKENIDINAVVEATKIANLHEFIKNQLVDGFDTIVGERGVRLSGGQRQRIGIARALYHKPNVIVLDEATSALDIKTEKEVMSSINNLKYKQITTIIIAHRLTTIKDCNIVFQIYNGEIVKKGNYKDLDSQ